MSFLQHCIEDNMAVELLVEGGLMDGEKYQFIAHSDLRYNAAKKTQYLKDNCLVVKVKKNGM